MLLSFIYWKYRDKRVITYSFIISFVFIAFRAPVVGADTWNYVRYLDGERFFYNNDERALEPLFVLYREILKQLTSTRFVVMLVNSVLSLAPLYYMTKKYSKNVPLTLLLFSFFGVMTVYFIALRQILALSLLYLGLIIYLEGKIKRRNKIIILVLCGVISYFVHTSSVFYFPIILFSLIPINERWYYYAMIVVSAVLGFILNILDMHTLLSFALGSGASVTERLIWYSDSSEYEGLISLTMLVRMSIIAIISIFFMDDERISHPFCKLFIAGVIIYNILYALPMIHRIAYPLYFFGAIIITWTMGIKYRINKNIHGLVNIFILAVVLYYARFNILELTTTDVYDASRMHPYYFIFQDYSNHPSILFFD